LKLSSNITSCYNGVDLCVANLDISGIIGSGFWERVGSGKHGVKCKVYYREHFQGYSERQSGCLHEVGKAPNFMLPSMAGKAIVRGAL
jgi:hypothetical protein